MKTCFLLILYTFASYFVGCEELSENQNGHKEKRLPTLGISEQQDSSTVEYQSNKVLPTIIKDVKKPNVESASVLYQHGGKQNVAVTENKGTKEMKQEIGQTESRIKEVQSQIEKKKEEIKQQTSPFIARVDKTLPVVNNNNSLDKHLTGKTDVVNNNDRGLEDLKKPVIRHGHNYVTTKLQVTRLPQTVSTKLNRVFKPVKISSLHPVSSTPYPGARSTSRPVSSTPYPGARSTSRSVSSTPYPGAKSTSRRVSSTLYPGDRPTSRPISGTTYPGDRPTSRPVSTISYHGNRPTSRSVSNTRYPGDRSTSRPVSSTRSPRDRPMSRPVSNTRYPGERQTLPPVSSTPYSDDKSTLRWVSSTTYPGEKATLRPVSSTPYPDDKSTLRLVSSTTYPGEKATLRPVYSKLHPETTSPKIKSEDPVDDNDFIINWDGDEDEDTSQDEVIPLEDDDETQWDGDNNVNLKVDEDENDALWEDEKENTDNVEDKLDDFVDEKDNVEDDNYDDEDDFNSIADKTGDFWDESSYNKNPFIKDKFVTKNYKSPFAEEMKMMGFYSWVLFVTVLLLIIFVFFTQQRHRCGKLTGFHHRYKRPSVSSEEGKGLMKNMYA